MKSIDQHDLELLVVGWMKYVPVSIGEGSLHQFSMEAKVKLMEYILKS